MEATSSQASAGDNKKELKRQVSVSKSRGKLWNDEATNMLIQLWGEETIQLALDNCKTSKQSGEVYKVITGKHHFLPIILKKTSSVRCFV